MFDSMHSDLDAIIKSAHVFPAICCCESESLPLDERHAGEVIIANILDVVEHVATVSMLRSAVPTRHELAVVEHFEEVRGTWWMRSINGVLEPDL